jgi:hypothetical protein
LKYEHLYRAPIDDGGALGMETARFRDIYSRPATALSAAPVLVGSHVRQLGRRPSAPLDMVDGLAATRSW